MVLGMFTCEKLFLSVYFISFVHPLLTAAIQLSFH